jgi:hypothetical protein
MSGIAIGLPIQPGRVAPGTPSGPTPNPGFSFVTTASGSQSVTINNGAERVQARNN